MYNVVDDVRREIQSQIMAGLERGVAVVSALIFVSALAPLALLPNLQDLIVLGALGAIGGLVFFRRRSSQAVMAVAAMGLVYGGFRLFLV